MESRVTRLGLICVGAFALGGCVEPESNLQDPSGASTSTTGDSSTGNVTTTTSTGGPSTNTATAPGTSTTGDDSSSSSDSSEGSTGAGGTTGGEPPDNACLVKDSYPDLGAADDALGFFVNFTPPRSTGVDVFLTDSSVEPFDTIIVELFEQTPPFNSVPQPGMYDIAFLGGVDACGGVCVSLQGDAVFDENNFVDAMFVLRATSGTLNVTGLQWDEDTPTNGMVEGVLADVVFEEYDPLLGEVVEDGCTATLEGVSFSEPVTRVLEP